MDDQLIYLSNQFKENQFTFTEKQEQQFYTFYKLLSEKNNVMNLTRIIEFKEVVEKHFLDSILVRQVICMDSPCSVLDLGTGAGFPGIPLKIAFPQIKITLLDSSKKKVDFINDVIGELGLKQAQAVHARAEDLARDFSYREKFDICVSRAVANLSTLMEYCIPFVRVGGTFVSYKSGEIEEEAKNAKRAEAILGGVIDKIYKFDLGENRRSFVVVKKEKKTPKRYPRKAGDPSRMPL